MCTFKELERRIIESFRASMRGIFETFQKYPSRKECELCILINKVFVFKLNYTEDGMIENDSISLIQLLWSHEVKIYHLEEIKRYFKLLEIATKIYNDDLVDARNREKSEELNVEDIYLRGRRKADSGI